MITPPLPSRKPLNTHTLSHILRQCKSATSRRRVIQREIAIIRAGREWGLISRMESLTYLDRIVWAFDDKRQDWNRPAFGLHFPSPPRKIEITTADMEQSI